MVHLDCQLVNHLVEVPRHSAAGPQRMNPEDFCDPLTFHLAPLAGEILIIQ